MPYHEPTHFYPVFLWNLHGARCFSASSASAATASASVPWWAARRGPRPCWGCKGCSRFDHGNLTSLLGIYHCYTTVQSGKHTKTIKNLLLIYHDLPTIKKVIFHGKLLVYQRVIRWTQPCATHVEDIDQLDSLEPDWFSAAPKSRWVCWEPLRTVWSISRSH